MTQPAFPPINAEEALIVGADFRADTAALEEIWATAQAQLSALATDPAMLALVAGGAASIELAQQRSAVLMAEANRVLARMEAETAQWSRSAVTRHTASASAVAVEAAIEQGASVTLGGALGVPNTQSIQLLLEELAADAEFAASSSRRVMRRHFRLTQQALVTEAALNTQLLLSEARLENLDQRTKRLTALMRGRAVNGQFVNVNGKLWRLETYGRLVANTRIAEAAAQGSLNAIFGMGIPLVRISDHGATDPVCDQFAGKVYSIVGGDKRFPPLTVRPPFHPNCRHIIQPFVAELKSPEEMRFAIARSQDRIGPGVSISEFARAAV